MSKRNFSMAEYWRRKADGFVPRMSFGTAGRDDFAAWRGPARDKLWSLMGEMPESVPLNPEVVYAVEDGDLIRERVVIDTEADMSLPMYVLRPKSMPDDRTGAAILCVNGHPAHMGKEPVAGIRSEHAFSEQIDEMNYDYGLQMARHGYLTLIPELRGFGERRDGVDPFPGRDACNVNFIKGAILGLYTLGLNVWDMMRCVDYLQTRAEVDPYLIGMMGLSYGGTITTFTAALDTRIKAADIMGYINPWAAFAIDRANFCGAQMVPEIYKHFETHDVAGLIAPRPLLIEMGIYDDCFFIQDLLTGYEGVRRIYEAAGADNALSRDVFPGPHRFAGNLAFSFFKEHL